MSQSCNSAQQHKKWPNDKHTNSQQMCFLYCFPALACFCSALNLSSPHGIEKMCFGFGVICSRCLLGSTSTRRLPSKISVFTCQGLSVDLQCGASQVSHCARRRSASSAEVKAIDFLLMKRLPAVNWWWVSAELLTAHAHSQASGHEESVIWDHTL